MKTTKLLIAAGLALAATSTFAETIVTTQPVQHVAQVYGRASAPAVKVAGSGQDANKGETQVAVQANKATVDFGRS